MDIRPWNVEEGTVKTIKVGNTFLHVKPDSHVDDPSIIVQTFCDAA
jgi:hypothetical protein